MPKYDLFISHANADSAWVNGYLLDALQQAGVNYHTETAFELGKPRIIEFENAIRASHRTLLVLSPDYLGDDSHQFIDVLIQTYGLETATWPLIPLILHPVSLPLRLKTLVKLDATNADERERAIERLCADLQRPVPSLAAKPVCPYPGMRSFSEAESRYFFGREPEIQELLAGPHLRLHRFVTIIGPSGSGKSSLVFAGLLPALRKSGLFGAGEWQVHSMRPGEIPLTTLKQILGGEPTQLQIAPPQRLLLIIDQFEELFTTAKQEAIPFQQALQSLLKVPHCYMVLTVRADFYPELMTCLLWKTIQKHRQEVVPLDEAGLREAIVKPADSVEVFVETALVERLVADAAGEPGILPFVQETLVLLWERLERRFLPLVAYEALVLPRQAYNWDGDKPLTGLQVAMANRADATLADLENQAIARRLFLRLIQFGEGRPDTRRQQSVVALRSADDNIEQFDATLEHLVAHRLLTRSAIESEADSQVDIAHEALINGWQQLQQWLKERRQAELTRRQLETKVAHWEGLKRAGGLLDAVELSEAENWLDSPDAKELGYSEDLLTLAQKSCEAIEAAEKEKEIALKQAEELAEERRKRLEEQKIATQKLRKAVKIATKQKNQALRTQSLFLADLARQETEKGDTTNGILLALESLPKDMSAPKRPYVSEAEVQLYNAVFNHRERLVLQGHKDYVTNASFSPDGQRIVTASYDKTARLWDAKDGSLLAVLKGHEKSVNNASFSSNGQCIVTASDDKTARLWDAKDGSLLAVLKGHEDSLNNASFSPNGQCIVTASYDKTARLWDAKDGSLLAVLKGHEKSVNNASFSSNGQCIVTASWDKTARLWDAKDGSLLAVLKGHEESLNNAAFSPDGQRIVTASYDKTARLWDAKDGSLLAVIKGHEKSVNNAAFSPDGQRIVTASDDNTARLWNAKDGQFAVLKGHEDKVTNTAFSPDGQRIVTASDDNTARLWNAKDGSLFALFGHEKAVHNASFSPDGQRIVTTASFDKTARLWNAKDGSLLSVLKEYDKSVTNAAFSPDGLRIITTASIDKSARLWNAKDGSLLAVLKGYEESVKNAAFSPDGQRIITTASWDKTARLWDAKDGSLLAVLKGHEESVENASFSPDGQRIVTASWDKTARLWDAKDGSLLTVIKGHVTKAAFSPDGQRIVTTSWDKTARLWDAKDGSLLIVLKGHENGVIKAFFSPDGQRIVTKTFDRMLWNDVSEKDRTARLWNAKDGSLLAVLKGHDKSVTKASFSPDGQRIVTTAFYDNTARLWDAKNGSLLMVLKGHEYRVENASFSPDGQRIVTASIDNTARLWDAKDASLLLVLKEHEGAVTNAAFSPDGQCIITASDDNIARLWDAKDGSLLAVLKGHEKSVYNAVFSPNGQYIVTASRDGTARLWRIFTTTQALIDYANQIVTRCLTPEQRQQFFLSPDQSYDLIEEGQQLAKQGDIKAAMAKFKEAKTIAPCHKFLNFPEDKAREIAAMSLIEKGKALAKQGQVEAAIEQFKQAQPVDGRFKFGDIEDYARRLSTTD